MSCKIIRSAGQPALDQPEFVLFDWGEGLAHPARPPVRPPSRSGHPPDPAGDEHLQDALRAAREQGFQEGARHAADAAQSQIQAALNQTGARLAESVAEVASLRPRLRREAETQVVELALAIARKVLHRAITIDAEALTGLVHAAVARIDARDLLSIRVAPCHLPQVQPALARLGLPGQVNLSPDASLEPGGLVLETTRGMLDASVTTQLAEIERGFTDYLEAGASS